MQSVPVAVLDKNFVQAHLIDATFSAVKAGHTLKFEDTAFALFSNHVDPIPFRLSTSMFVVVVNKLAAPLTLKLNASNTDEAYFGAWQARPAYVIYDDRHEHYLNLGPEDEIPAASAADGTVGVGVLALTKTSPVLGMGGAFEISSSDPNLETPIWVGCVYTNRIVDTAEEGVAVTDDTTHYADLRAFYDARCEDRRTVSDAVSMAKGQGKDPEHAYSVTAAVAYVGKYKDSFISEEFPGMLAQKQVIVVVDSAPQ